MLYLLLLTAGAGAFGWFLGIPLSLAASHLQAGWNRSPMNRVSRLLAPDPPLQAFQALTLAALALRFGWSLPLVAYGAISLALTLVLFVDLRTRLVYIAVAYPGIVLGIILSPVGGGGAIWDGLASAALGATAFGALYGIGRILYRGATPLAGGDVIVAALAGAAVGLPHLFTALVLGTLLNGVLAVATAIRRGSLQGYLPYGPGLCLGALIALLR
jgi:prepilin signal peptidase PulO-like enzyme (type II secretory pathway)